MTNKINILVIGGAGFIGNHFVDRLLKDGQRVVVFDNLSSGKFIWLKDHLTNESFTFIKGDLSCLLSKPNPVC